MKHIFSLLLSGLILPAFPTTAQASGPATVVLASASDGSGKGENSSEEEDQEVASHTAQITTYLTAALRLTAAQAAALREQTRHHLQLRQQARCTASAAEHSSATATGTTEVNGPYHQALQRILTPEQYQSLLQLEFRSFHQPIAVLLFSLR